MSQTVIKKYVLNMPATPGSDEKVVEVGQELAEVLGCNFLTNLKVLYVDNSDYGIQLSYASNNLIFKLYANGSVISNGFIVFPGGTNTNWISFGNTYVMRYIKTDNVIMFVFDNTSESNAAYNRITLGMVKGKVLTDNERESWIYFGLNGTNFYYVCEGSNVTNNFNVAYPLSSSSTVSLSPFIINNGDVVVTSDYFFKVATCAFYERNIAFSLNDDEYLIISNTGINTNATRLAVKLT